MLKIIPRCLSSSSHSRPQTTFLPMKCLWWLKRPRMSQRRVSLPLQVMTRKVTQFSLFFKDRTYILLLCSEFDLSLCEEKAEAEPTTPADTCEQDPQAPPPETQAEEAPEKQPDTPQAEAQPLQAAEEAPAEDQAPDVESGAASVPCPEAAPSEEPAAVEGGASQPDASPEEPVESCPDDKPGAESSDPEAAAAAVAAAAVMAVAAAAADPSPPSTAPVSAEPDDSLTTKTGEKGKAKASTVSFVASFQCLSRNTSAINPHPVFRVSPITAPSTPAAEHTTVTTEELTQHKNYLKVVKRQERDMKALEKKYQKKAEDLMQKYGDSFKAIRKKASVKKAE